EKKKKKRKRYLLYFPSLFLLTPSLFYFIFSSLSLLPSPSFFVLFPLSLFLFFFLLPLFFFSFFSRRLLHLSALSLSFFLLQLPPPKLLLLLHGVTSMAAKGKNQSLPLNSRSAMGSSDPIDPMVDPPLHKGIWIP
ncbi:unnamed protein product, partial [Prunus brigantina]